MSPVEQSRGHAGKALALAFGGVLVAIAFAFGLSVLASRGDVEVNIGDDVFQAGDVERIAQEIDDRGPITYSDVSGGDRDIIVQHLGDDPNRGWLAFDARPPDAESRDCFLEWNEPREQFVDTCTGGRYPPDGGDLPRYPTRVVDGDLEVDLRADE